MPACASIRDGLVLATIRYTKTTVPIQIQIQAVYRMFNMLYLSCKGVRAKNYIHTNNFILFKNLLFNNNNTWLLTLPQIQTYVACTQ